MELSTKRHSLSHVLAQAVQRDLSVHTKLGIGPAIDTGSYYDFVFPTSVEVNDETLKTLQATMTKILKEGQDFCLIACDEKQSESILKLTEQEYKMELRAEFLARGDKVTFYANTIKAAAKDALLKDCNPEYIKECEIITDYLRSQYPGFEALFVTFIDMCAGPHVENTKELDTKSFKLEKLAGAYWRGDEKNVMMTRIYILAFETKEELDAYILQQEEAKKRDHRVLGQKLKLFTFHEDIGLGLPLRLPNGNIIKEEIERRAKETEAQRGYQRVTTPMLTKEKLFLTSEHLPHYKASMYSAIEIEGENYYIKPMNCPFHHKIFESLRPTYKELPLRIAEYGNCHRYEDSGSLHGLMRVRGMCMNDAHIYCRKEQAVEEFVKVIELHQYYYTMLGISEKDYFMELALRNPENDKYHGDDAMRKEAEELMKLAMDRSGVKYVVEHDGAAFYGPKIDFQIKGVTGKVFTASTNQIDLFMPGKFNLSYINEKGEKEQPVCIHRAPLGTHERFIGFLIEHFAGAFPVRLAPVQATILPVASSFLEYGTKILASCKAAGLRVSLDDSGESLGKQIRNAELMKIPYMLVIGEKEEMEGTVTIRSYATKEQATMKMEEFVEKLLLQYKERSLVSF